MKMKDKNFWKLAEETKKQMKDWPQWKRDFLEYKASQRKNKNN